MTRVTSVDELEPGSVLWAYARGYWRQVRVVARVRTRARVTYMVRATSRGSASLTTQDLPASRFRRDRPIGVYGVLDVPPPPHYPLGGPA